ncbi:asparagine synthetase B family protein [Chromobacterium subtsugae]|uniref:asparagine synthetase B family protein n=1 Tax=Chromobacterium subtsugae TaxID=251747 RepID=UPI0006412C63|nr:asparagine synthetase B family protein [Chromobacterium subtsugae]
MLSAEPIYGLIAKTALARADFAGHWRQRLPATFPAAGADWFVSAAGLALHAPQTSAGPHGGQLALCCRGRTYGAAALSLEALQRDGARAFERCAGEFALAFWDEARGQLLLARDQMGQRSLFIREDAHHYLLCSELEPLLADPDFDCQLDAESAVHYLMFGAPYPGRTLARRVSKLPAAHYLSWNGAGPLLSHRYYTPIGFDAPKVVGAAEREQLERTLDQAIHARLADGGQAILLSGGVDSSYIAATAAMRAGGERLDAYTIEFTAPYPHNESQYARIVTDAYGIRHHAVELGPEQATAALADVFAAAEPCSAWSSITHRHLLARIGADGHRSLLSGLGADEVFGGYWKFFQSYAKLRFFEESWPAADAVDSIDGLMWQPTPARSRLFSGIPRFHPDSALRAALPQPYKSWSHAPQLIEFYRQCRRYKPDAHLFELMVAHECQHRVPDLLFAGFEPPARSQGIHTAYPFLAPEVAEQACGLGAAERFWRKDNRWRNKKVLREIAAKRVPDAIMQRPLYSYNAPIAQWMQHPDFSAAIYARLRDAPLWDSGFVQRGWLSEVEAQIRSYTPRAKAAHFTCFGQMWVLATLAAWHQRWVARQS